MVLIQAFCQAPSKRCTGKMTSRRGSKTDNRYEKGKLNAEARHGHRSAHRRSSEHRGKQGARERRHLGTQRNSTERAGAGALTSKELRRRATENGSTTVNRQLAACARGPMVDGDHGRRDAWMGEQQGEAAADITEQGAGSG